MAGAETQRRGDGEAGAMSAAKAGLKVAPTARCAVLPARPVAETDGLQGGRGMDSGRRKPGEHGRIERHRQGEVAPQTVRMSVPSRHEREFGGSRVPLP